MTYCTTFVLVSGLTMQMNYASLEKCKKSGLQGEGA